MATFEVEGPDGAVYEIEAPDEAQATTAFKQFIGQQGGVAQPEGQGFANNLAQSAGDGLFMGFGDEISAGLNALTGYDANTGSYGNWGTTYDDQLAAVRGQERQFESDHPVISTAAEIGGSVLPALAGVGFASQGTSLASKVARGAVSGAAMGGIYGFGEGENGFSDRAGDALVNAGIGGFIGGAIPAGAAVAKHLYRAGEGALRNSRVGRALGDALGVNRDTGSIVARILAGEDPAAMQEALGRAGPDAMLADASAGLTGALDASMRSPVPGAGVARQRVNDRAGQAFYDVLDALNPAQGPRQPIGATMDAIRTGTAGARASAYDAAYSKPIDYAGDAGARLLDRITPRLPPEAVNYANRLMRLRGEQSAQIMAQVADDGTMAFTRPPDVRQWDYIKQALDQLAESGDGAGALGGQTRIGAAYQSLAREVRDSVAEAVPEYKTALDTAADAITRRQAVEFGSTMLRPQVTTEEALERIAHATDPQRRAMRDGIRGQIEEVLGNVRAVPSDQNVDARKAAAAFRELSSPNAQRKMEALFGDEWEPIRQQLDRAGAALGLRASTASNSQTAPREFFNQIVQETVQPSTLAQGKPLAAARGVVAELTGASREAVGRARDEVKAEIAELLTRQNGAPSQVLSEVVKALAANPVRPGAGSSLERTLQMLGFGSVPQSADGLRQIFLGQ